jgi:carboxypeptidase Q
MDAYDSPRPFPTGEAKLKIAFSVLMCSVFILPSATVAQAPAPSRPGVTAIAPSDTTGAARLIREIRDHQSVVRDVEYLADVIGPRLTGSAGLLRAHAWAESTMTARGMVNVHREGYDFGPSWTRGPASARLTSHNGVNLSVAALAWAPSTKGTVRGQLIPWGGKSVSDLAATPGQFRGKIILVGAMPTVSIADSATVKQIVQQMVTDGAVAVLGESDKALALNMSGSPNWRYPLRPQIPTGILSKESFALLTRLLGRNEPVTIELNFSGTTSPQGVQAFNTIGEIRGSENPDEVVIIGAHMDSWDLGTGATDNGTGTAAVLEALRAIKALGVTPKRTIRGILFSGEEQGILGSKAYVAAHASEMPRIQAVLIDDLGTGRINGWALQKFENARPYMAEAIAPLNELGVTSLPLEWSRDSDHWPFTQAGVPAFFGVQDGEDYFTVTHHSQFDTFSHVKPESLIEGATALAVTAWELANMESRLPHGTH